MRTVKMLGALLLVAAVYVATRGDGWHISYIVAAAFLGLFGAALVSKRRTHRFKMNAYHPRPRGLRPARVLVK